ncbi:hypothetical protein SH601_07380 [Gracilibacillus sp. S3-1-1]|uniref:Uncharacterized protein n=1 Tax=Gracilibacillus pellucidus TaxID=3095368 RepID=A0ACC6M4D0_9BACI|nr:hypothetical protein [Gracilibacillus sp. S3-1-1]MDX8045810.1 hypothetical protein [Gracilibacillus sp. S3-1-1]
MSEKKKVIYVKDLVIKADNVRIEPNRRHDHFFGPRGMEQEEQELDSIEEVEEKKDDRDERPPFSWV